MPEVICTTVYQFPELSEAAKEKARSWYRDLGPHDDWWDAVYEDFERVCEILGIRLKTRTVRLVGGRTREDPCIWFSGFWSQGDGDIVWQLPPAFGRPERHRGNDRHGFTSGGQQRFQFNDHRLLNNCADHLPERMNFFAGRWQH